MKFFVTLVYRDDSREILRAEAYDYKIEGSCLSLIVDAPGGRRKIILVPVDLLQSIEIQWEAGNELSPPGFRELPDKSPWFAGMGISSD